MTRSYITTTRPPRDAVHLRERGAVADHETALHGGLHNDTPTQTTVLIVNCVRTEQP